MKKNTIKLNESKLRQVIMESINKILNEGISSDELAQKFINWALNKSDRTRRIGGPINALQAMQYYYQNDDSALEIAAEAFAEAENIDSESEEVMAEVLEAAKKAANSYFYYNSVDGGYEEEQLAESKKDSRIRLSESKLRNIIKESIKKIFLNEYFEDFNGIDADKFNDWYGTE